MHSVLHCRVYNYFFWVPLVIPHFGAILGAIIYQLFVGIHAESDEEVEKQMTYLKERDNSVKGSSIEALYATTGHDTIPRTS